MNNKEYPTSIEEILDQLKEDHLVAALDQKIHQKWARSGYDSLTEAEKVFLRVHGVHVEVANGGFDQYFYNSEGDFAQDAPAAFRAIGADLIAGIVSRACSVFPDGKPTRDRKQRLQLLLDIGEEGKQLLDQLTGEFFDNQPGQGQLLEDYIIEHKVDF